MAGGCRMDQWAYMTGVPGLCGGPGRLEVYTQRTCMAGVSSVAGNVPGSGGQVRVLAGTLVGVMWSLFQLYTGFCGELSAIPQRAVHLGFALTLVFLLRPLPGGKSGGRYLAVAADGLLIAGALAATGYLVRDHVAIAERLGMVLPWELCLGLVVIVVVLEGTRRVVGWPLPLIALAFLFYALFGNILPGYLGHRAYSLERVVGQVYLMTEGIFGVVLGVSAGYLFLFVVFATFLKESGGGQLFTELAMGLAGRSRGGPAKIAVLSSAMFGSISGSAVANVVGTGSFTIPLMMRVGYPPRFAGAVEAVASTGGVLMPPIMGATAFVMAELLSISYWDVVRAALAPALLYYCSLFAMIHMEALKLGLRGLSPSELPDIRQTIRELGHLALPLVGLVVLLCRKPDSISAVASWSIVMVVLVAALRSGTRMGPVKVLRTLARSAEVALPVVLTCACVGIVVGVVMLTGLGVKMAVLFSAWSRGYLLLLLLGAALGALVMGMGLPITPAYLIIILTIGPALGQLGLPPLVLHMFVLYFAAISFITPPVAVAAYAAAALVGENPMRTGYTATRLGVAGFLVPFAFAANPALLLMGPPGRVALAVVTALLGVLALAVGVQGYFRCSLQVFERLLLLAAGPLLVVPGWRTDVAGVALVVLFLLWHTRGALGDGEKRHPAKGVGG